MKRLLIDIETTPHLAWTFDLKNTFIPHENIAVASTILCFAAGWYGEDEVEWYDSRDADLMYLRLWQLLDEADAIIHQYGERFDNPRIRGELWQRQFLPPSPYRQIDLWKTSRTMGLASTSLAYVSKLVGKEEKLKSGGMQLWLRCIAGDEDAWAEMQEYNMQDVRAMVPIYESYLPWITNHPSFGALAGEDLCPNCGGSTLIKQGYRTTRTGRYQRYSCGECGAWSSATRREAKTEIVSAT